MAAFVSSEVHITSTAPNKIVPGKSYSYCGLFRSLKVYPDGMVYASLNGASEEGKICIAKVEPGTHALKLSTVYQIGTTGSPFVSETDAVPTKGTDPSQFIRVHISTCGKGTKVYYEIFNDFDKYLDSIGMNAEKFMKDYL